tara:strand:- start:85 stop:393 length:309 start_codon:yes stop_codon:yes gene_type:complete
MSLYMLEPDPPIFHKPFYFFLHLAYFELGVGIFEGPKQMADLKTISIHEESGNFWEFFKRGFNTFINGPEFSVEGGVYFLGAYSRSFGGSFVCFSEESIGSR